MSDIDDDGIPDLVEKMVGQDLIGPKDLERIAAAKAVAGDIVDKTAQVIESVGGQAAVDAVGDIVDNVIDDMRVRSVSMKLPEDAPARRAELTDVRDDASIKDFLANVLAQVGDRYQRGVDNSLRDADPDSWEGSELVEWGANRAGSMVNDGAQNQYKQMVRHDGDVAVDVALVTPGAVLYEFTGDPHGSAKPTRASTAISLGDGKHIIDIDPVHGVRIVEAKDFTFTHAGVMPGFIDSRNPGPTAHDLVEDALKAAGLEPGPAMKVSTTPSTATPDTGADAPRAKDPAPTGSSDDEPSPEAEDPAGGPRTTTDPAPPRTDETPAPRDPGAAQQSIGEQAASLEARAKALRSEFLERHAVGRADDLSEVHELARKELEAQAGAEEANTVAQLRRSQAEDALKDVTRLESEAAAANQRGDTAAAEELQEQADVAAAKAKRLEAVARDSATDAERRLAEAEALKVERLKLRDEYEEDLRDLTAAETSIDQIETKARLLREAEAHAKRAVDLESEAALLRDQGNTAEADARHNAAVQARSQARQSETLAASQQIDEAKLSEAGLLGGPSTTETTPPRSPLDDDVTGADATNAEVAGPAMAGSPSPAPDAADDEGDASVDGVPDPAVAGSPAPLGDGIDAHATAADLVPDMPDPSQVASADPDDGRDPWTEAAADDAAPTTYDDTTSDLEA